MRTPPLPQRHVALVAWWTSFIAGILFNVVAAPMAARSAAGAEERFDLETSDGVSFTTSLYAAQGDTKPLGTVILIHDLVDGSHESVESLAVLLQQAGCTVAVPDLGARGATIGSGGKNARDDKPSARQLRKADIECMAAGAGGRVREQPLVSGEIETVYAFLAARGQAGEKSSRRLAVVGCGAGATLAALWTAADWSWPAVASGPQGQQVRALVLVSPEWAVKGISLQAVFSADALKRQVPVMLLAGERDDDAIRLFELLKRQRPLDWFDQRAGAEPTMGKNVHNAKESSLILIQSAATVSSAKLADDRNGATVIAGFLKSALGDE